ncbi:MAG: type II toxin-antitoxin system VapB family antitoxin [Ignavibacteriales bacterium]
MAFHVRDRETDALVRELARKRQVGLTDAIKLAVGAELRRETQATPILERIRAIRAEVAQRERTGLKADKSFFDELSGDED